MTFWIIPARKGSKRFKNKNRKLLSYTLKEIPSEVRERTIITTDDEHIWNHVSDMEVKLHERSERLAGDEVSMREVLISVAEDFNFEKSDTFVMLYLTYPGREYEDIKSAINFFQDRGANSLLCRQPVKSHPYLCMHAEENNRGSQVIDHELYRYQDYPEVFELSHFIAIQKVGEIPNLNPNLYNEDTVYYPISNVIDVDHKKDFEKFLNERQR